MFRAIITEKGVKIQGTESEMLTGLSCYVEAFKSNGMPEFLINEAIKIGLGKAKEEPTIEVKHNGDKIEFNNMPKDKEMEVLEKFLDIIKDSLGD